MPAIQVENPVTVTVKRFASKTALQDYARRLPVCFNFSVLLFLLPLNGQTF